MVLSPSTVRVYESTLRRVYGIDPAVPPKVEGGEVTALPPGSYNEGTTNSTRSIIRGAIRWWYSRAGVPEVGERVANAVPFRHETKKRKRYPSTDEIAEFWKAVEQEESPKRELAAIPLLLGLRANELLSLSRAAVEQAVETGILTVERKGAKEGELPVARAATYFRNLLKLDKFTKQIKAEGPWSYVWQLYSTSPKGAYLVMYRVVSRIAKAAKSKVEWTPHVLRHAFASEMIRAGAPLAVVQRALGHSSYLTTVRTYVHIDVKDLEKWMNATDAVVEGKAVPVQPEPSIVPKPVTVPEPKKARAPKKPKAVPPVVSPVTVTEIEQVVESLPPAPPPPMPARAAPPPPPPAPPVAVATPQPPPAPPPAAPKPPTTSSRTFQRVRPVVGTEGAAQPKSGPVTVQVVQKRSRTTYTSE